MTLRKYLIRRITEILLVQFAVIIVLAGCSTKHKVNLSAYTDEQLFQEAQKLIKRKKWAEARERLQYLTRIHLNSPFREEAYILIGDTYQHEGFSGYELAIQTYQDFLRLYPNSPKAPYALLQIGELYFKKSEKPQRTQEFTRKAIEIYQKVLQQYPTSDEARIAEQRLKICYERLALHEYIVAKFYFSRKNYRGALWRLEYIFQKYPEKYIPPKVYFLMVKTLLKFGREEDALQYLYKVQERYPKTTWAVKAEHMIQGIQKSGEKNLSSNLK